MPEKRSRRYYSVPDSETFITASELRKANRETQKEVMRYWFHQHYTDPVENTPYESAEGGYIYIWGGPYEPREKLETEFGSVAKESAIEELADELREITWEWTGNPDEHDVDEYLFDSIARSVPAIAYHSTIANISSLLEADVGEDEVRQNLLRMLYANVITALEAYLAEFFISQINSDPELFKKFVETNADFQKQKFSVSEVFQVRDAIQVRAKEYLSDLVWHRLDKVKELFSAVLEIEFPKDMRELFKAVLIRHDIVHRNGKSPDGKELTITKQQVQDLMGAVTKFVEHIENWKPPAEEASSEI